VVRDTSLVQAPSAVIPVVVRILVRQDARFSNLYGILKTVVFANLTSYPDMIPPSHISSSAYLHTIPVLE